MREILFRAKRKNWRELTKEEWWVEGYAEKLPIGKWLIARKCDNPPDDDPMWKEVLITYEIAPETLCQYTGLTDKNGKKIWENDIVRAREGVTGTVKFGKYGDMGTDYGFYIEWDKIQPYWRNDIGYWQKEIEVIGNAFDIPIC